MNDKRARYLVVCDPADDAAFWAHQGLIDRGLDTDLVTSDDLAGARRWRHRLGAHGVDVDVVLADGRVVDSRFLAGTLNRLVGVPPLLVAVAQPTDREYAGQELFAFFLSWLHCLPGPMLNRPTPQGLCGAWRHDSQWAVLAAEAGLRTSPYRMTSEAPAGDWAFGDDVLREEHVATVVVVGEELIGGPGGAEVDQGCRRLAVLADTELLGVDLVEDQPGSWAFLQAVPQPDLRVGREPLLDALVKALTAGQSA